MSISIDWDRKVIYPSEGATAQDVYNDVLELYNGALLDVEFPYFFSGKLRTTRILKSNWTVAGMRNPHIMPEVYEEGQT